MRKKYEIQRKLIIGFWNGKGGNFIIFSLKGELSSGRYLKK
jgi:hypothetical protein